jgi:lipopolysaccharide/colanic/teichoic acid biosynthesis glycosyltransferase
MRRIYLGFVKPVCDFAIALPAFIVLLPAYMLIAVAIRIDSVGPSLFVQERLGRRGKVFRIYKFRSMRVDLSFNTTETLSSDPRITRVGNFIRKTSLDELPQLINILKGDMSFIGPRPPLTGFPKPYAEYTEFEKRRFEVKPGVSGLAAVRQREVHDWSKNFPLDVEYVEKVSALFDVKLFVTSLLCFFRTNNVYSRS